MERIDDSLETCPHGVSYWASEHGPECEDCAITHAKRQWLKKSGYQFHPELEEWSKIIRKEKRKDWEGRYYVHVVIRIIEDNTGSLKYLTKRVYI